MNVDTKELKEQLNTNQIIELVESLGGELVSGYDNVKQCIFTSICHNINASDPSHKPKLYYYKETNMFKCYVCDFSGDIYSLIEGRWMLEDKEFEFRDVIGYILNTLHLDGSLLVTKKKRASWKNDLKKLITRKKVWKPYAVYEKTLLEVFDDVYHQEWIDDGITIETMYKYDIGYYGLLDCTTIPVFDEEYNLVGVHGRFWNPQDIEDGKYRPVHTLNHDFKFPTSEFLYGLNLNKDNISDTRTVCLFEAPKSVLQMETIVEQNNAVAMFGWNMSAIQRDILLKYGVENWMICLDKQYKKIYPHDYQDTEDEGYQEYRRWVSHVVKIINLLKGFGNVYVVYDTGDLLGYTDSPSDKGREVFYKLLEGKRKV